MNKQELLNQLTNESGALLPKRCTQTYLDKYGLTKHLDKFIDPSFGTPSERIKHLKYGGGFCEVCNTRTSISPSGKGFAQFCKQHYAINNGGQNKVSIDDNLIISLYEAGHPVVHIAKQIGCSNVTIMKRLRAAGVKIRSHSENQKMNCTTRGKTIPRIHINRQSLIDQYNHKIPIRILADQYNCDPETIRRFLKQEGVERVHRRSYLEWIIADMLRELGIQYMANTRSCISPLELDFFIPDHNVAIELHGLYTHSFAAGGKDKLYHYSKFDKCNQSGIKLFQFWESDVVHKLPVIKSMISNACGTSEKLGARKTNVVMLPRPQLFQFFEENHIQGRPANNANGIALEYDGKLVASLAYTYYNNTITIARFCNTLNHSVVGGFSKLMKHISHQGNEIITYSSNDISTGELYSATGFTNTKSRDWDMWYTDYNKLINRSKFMKHKITHWPTFDDNLTETDNVLKAGYDVVYKSGTKTWVLHSS